MSVSRFDPCPDHSDGRHRYDEMGFCMGVSCTAQERELKPCRSPYCECDPGSPHYAKERDDRLHALTQRPAAQTEREAFEAWWESDGPNTSSPYDAAMSGWNAGRASLPAPQQATPEPLIVKGAMAGMVDAQVRDLWPTKGATPEPVEYKCRHCGVTTIEDEGGVTMHGLPAPERPIMFDPSADVPIPAPPEPVGWTDADADAARLAMELECLLLDTKDTAAVSRWWKSANEALDLHRARLAAAQAKGGQ